MSSCVLITVLCYFMCLTQLDATPFGFLMPQTGTGTNSPGAMNYTPVVNFLTALRQESSETAYPFVTKMRETIRQMTQQIANLGLQMGLLANQVANNKLNHLSQVVNSFKPPYGVPPATPAPTRPTNATGGATNTTKAT